MMHTLSWKMVSHQRNSVGPQGLACVGDGSAGEADRDAANARGFVAKLCPRPAAPSRTMGRRGPLAPGPRPAQQFRRVYGHSTLALLPFVAGCCPPGEGSGHVVVDDA